MTREDFVAFNIHYFTPSEITATGARLRDVRARLIQHLDRFRAEIGVPITLIKNGLTTGEHTSQQHKEGIASDIVMPPVQPIVALKSALNCGFRGIGFYWNKKWVSMHLDLRSEYGFWIGVKRSGKASWQYEPLIREPT